MALDPWSVSSWSPAVRAAAGRALGLPWKAWESIEITASILVNLQSAAATIADLGPIAQHDLLGMVAGETCNDEGRAMLSWVDHDHLHDFEVEGSTVVLLSDGEPIERSDGRGDPYWLITTLDPSIELLERPAPILREHERGEPLGLVRRCWVEGDVLFGELSWRAGSREARRTRQALEQRRLAVSAGLLVGWGQEIEPRLVRRPAAELIEVSIVEHPACRAAGVV